MKVVAPLLSLVVACLIPLMFGIETILLVNLPGGLPLGTLLAAIAFISASFIPISKSKPGSFLRRIGSVLLLASILWLPLGIYLSGNAALSFVQDAADSHLFWRFTAGLGVSILVSLLWTGVETIRASRAG